MNDDKRGVPDHEPADDRVSEAVRLDGKFAAGILSEVFVPDMTTTRAMCANCGATNPIGALAVSGQNMGAVMRCPACSTVVLRATRTSSQLWLDATGARLLLMAEPTPWGAQAAAA